MEAQASAYLSVVDSTGRGQSPETMAFKRADAVAMGQRLLVRQDQAEPELDYVMYIISTTIILYIYCYYSYIVIIYIYIY